MGRRIVKHKGSQPEQYGERAATVPGPHSYMSGAAIDALISGPLGADDSMTSGSIRAEDMED